MSRLAARGITIAFGGLTVLDGVDLTIGPGDRVGIVAPNGVGNPVTGLRRSSLAHQADLRIPGQRASSRMRPPS
jgi:ABC-type branched-subunit amino acid transport system ATPase component